MSSAWLESARDAAARRKAALDKIKAATKDWTVQAKPPAGVALVEPWRPTRAPSVLMVIRERYAARARYILAAIVTLTLAAVGFLGTLYWGSGKWVPAVCMGYIVPAAFWLAGIVIFGVRWFLMSMWRDAIESDRGKP